MIRPDAAATNPPAGPALAGASHEVLRIRAGSGFGWPKSPVGRFLFVSAIFLLLVGVFLGKVQDKMPDFEVYWQAGARALAGEQLYRAQDGHYQFKYLPAFALATSPLSRLPLPAAKAVWFLGSVALLLLMIRLSVGLLPEHRLPVWITAGCAALALAKFYAHELVLGQSNLIMTAVVLLGLARLRSGCEAQAGALLGLGVFVKPYGIVFLPYLAARRRWQSFAAMSGCVATGLMLPAVAYGLQGNVALLTAWTATLLESTPPNLATQDNISIAGMFAKWAGVGSMATTLSVVAGSILVILTAAAFVRRAAVAFPEYLETALILMLIPLLSPQGWDYVLLTSTPAVVCVLNYQDRLPRVIRQTALVSLAVVGLSVYDLLGRDLYAIVMSLSIITICYVMVFLSLCYLRFRRVV